MKKLILFLIIGIFMVSFTSAWQWDNVKNYDAETKTVDIRSSVLGIPFLQLGKVAEIKLISDLDVRVPIGYQKVAEFELTYFADDNGGLDEMNFYNIKKDFKKIDREFDFKILKNNKWVDFNFKDLLKDKKVTIGIFTDVQDGDYIEWIPTFFGVEIDEWATWTADLNIDLMHYYKLDETSGVNAVDDAGTVNGTADNARVFTSSVPGIINTSADFTQGTDSISMGDIAWIDTAYNLSISLWANFSAFNNRGTLIAKTDDGGADDAVFIIENLNSGVFRAQIRTVNDNTQTILFNPGIMNTNVFTHIVLLVNETNISFYVNGSLVNSSVREDFDLFNPNANNLSIGRYGSAANIYFNDMGGKSIDEVVIWNRSISPLEITNLFNTGSGIQYQQFNCKYNYNSINTSVVCNNSGVAPTITSPTSIVNYGVAGGVLALNFTDGVSNFTNNITLADQTNLTFFFTNSTGEFSEFVDWDYKIFENSRTFNTTTFETKQENISIDFNANTSLTAVNLIYNGTAYATTFTDNISSRVFDVSLGTINQTFFWSFTYGSETINSTTSRQDVQPLVFELCNTTLTTRYINYTFVDEGNLSNLSGTIPTSNFTYYIGSGSITKETIYSSAVANTSYAFCSSASNDTLNIDTRLQYESADYPQRVHDPITTAFTNATTNTKLYLLYTGDGQFVTFQVINTAEQALSDVFINASRSISSVFTVVDSGFTSSAGSLTMWLDPDFLHTFNFAKSGFDTLVSTLAPTLTSYTVTLGGTTAITEDDLTRGISYQVQPTLQTLVNGTTYNFNFTLNTSFWVVENFGFNLTNGTGTVIVSNSSTSDGGIVSVSVNTIDNESIIMDYFWTINSTTINASRTWIVLSSEGTDWSISVFFTDLTAYISSNIFGLDDFGFKIIIFLTIFIFIGIMSFKFGFTSPGAVSLMVFVLVAFFDVALGVTQMNPINAIPHFPTIFMGLISIGLLIRGGTR